MMPMRYEASGEVVSVVDCIVVVGWYRQRLIGELLLLLCPQVVWRESLMSQSLVQSYCYRE